MRKKQLKRIVLIAAGSAALVLGGVGVLLPVLPTTPFLLLACFCYLRSSDRLYNWLIHHKIFGRYIYNYMRYRAVTKRTKIVALVVLWTGLVISAIAVDHLIIRLVLAVVGIGVSAHLLHLKTLPGKREVSEKPKKDE